MPFSKMNKVPATYYYYWNIIITITETSKNQIEQTWISKEKLECTLKTTKFEKDIINEVNKINNQCVSNKFLCMWQLWNEVVWMKI